jgi:hypothetical protein
MGDERGPRTQPCRRRSGFAAGMAAANHDDIKACHTYSRLLQVLIRNSQHRVKKFHVKRAEQTRNWCNRPETSFADAEFREYHVEQILDIDAAGDPPKGVTCQSKLFRLDVETLCG